MSPFRNTGNSSALIIRLKERGIRNVLVGDSAGLLLAMRFHSPRGTACWRYAIAAKQCGSIEGREKAGPQTWSSRTIANEGEFGEKWVINSIAIRSLTFRQTFSPRFALTRFHVIKPPFHWNGIVSSLRFQGHMISLS